MSEIEISDEAATAELETLAEQARLGYLVTAPNAAKERLAAAYPSLRRQVLESVVEGVAKRLHDLWSTNRPDPVAWDDLDEVARDWYRNEARKSLGIEGEQT